MTADESTEIPMSGGTTATARPAPGPAVPAPSGAAPGRGTGMAAALRPLVIDVGVPLGSYYLLHGAFGLSVWLSLALSSIAPAVRTAFSLAVERKPNLLALLMLAVNLGGIAVSLLTGDPRAMIAKDSLVSSVIARSRSWPRWPPAARSCPRASSRS
jgi:hypothetical protein